MDETKKIFKYAETICDSYKESIQIINGLEFNHQDTIRTIEFYSNNKYTQAPDGRDELGREMPFYNVNTYRVTVAKLGSDIDVKDLPFEPDSLNFSVQAMMINKELFNIYKEINLSETLNDIGKTRPKYGGVIIKKHDGEDGFSIQVVEWKNVDVDPVDILGNTIIENHHLLPSELQRRSDVWSGYDDIDDVLKAHRKASKNKPERIHVKEITGVFDESFDPDIKDGDESKFKTMCFYVACVGKKHYLLYKEDLNDVKDKYRYLPWEKVPGRDLGRGIVEEGFEAQTWTNDAIVSMKNAMELTGKVVGVTTSKKVSGNVVADFDNGHMFEIEAGATLDFKNMGASTLPQFEKVMDLWNSQFDRVSSTFDANTGETPPSGTPYSQTALLNQVANAPLEYQREVAGIWVNGWLNDWLVPYAKKRILKNHNLVAEYTDEELALIDEAIANYEGKRTIISNLTKGTVTTPEMDMMNREMTITNLRKNGKKRELNIPKGFLDVAGKITANITGELKNKAAMFQSMAQIGKDIISTFNPQTGTFGAFEDPTLRQIYKLAISMTGVPIAIPPVKKAEPMMGMNPGDMALAGAQTNGSAPQTV